MDRTVLQARLEELRRERAEGMRALEALLRREADLRDTLRRIDGAMQVLNEMLGEASGGAP
ncbi:hypothetical protein [Paracraurococcus ruber]|uniref:hypothetical protein n=1 Tax=Paracraurococcus ruber TaxID=77675 RepID=UPI0019081B72|nr:hypothetical protein [Paracraurococcus ruber]